VPLLVINTLPSYRSISNAAVGNTVLQIKCLIILFGLMIEGWGCLAGDGASGVSAVTCAGVQVSLMAKWVEQCTGMGAMFMLVVRPEVMQVCFFFLHGHMATDNWIT
jgi:hypothetical protein